MLKKIFFFKDIDSHYVFCFLGMRLRIKHKVQFNYKEAIEFGLNTQERKPQLIVSLTSHPKRIKTTHKTINTLLQQTLKPDKIILWLTEEEFPNKENDLPKEIIKLKDFGLTIDWCEAIKSYKKLIPSLKKFPEDIIVTVDDDIYYEPNMLENLYTSYLENPKNIHANRISRKALLNNKIVKISSRKYLYEKTEKASYTHFLNGAGGILYPPHSLHQDAIKPSEIIKNDDYYFWAMAVLNKTKIQEVMGYEADIKVVEGTQQCAFSNIKNEADWANITLKIYPQLIEIIKNDSKKNTEVLSK